MDLEKIFLRPIYWLQILSRNYVKLVRQNNDGIDITELECFKLLSKSVH